MSAELQLKISELQNKLGAQATPSEEKPISEMEEQVTELQRRLETEVQERRTAEEKSATLELKVAELEKASEALLRSQNMCEQVQLQLKVSCVDPSTVLQTLYYGVLNAMCELCE